MATSSFRGNAAGQMTPASTVATFSPQVYTFEQVCRALHVEEILVSPSRRVMFGPDGQPLKNEDGSNKLTYQKHKNGVQKFFCHIASNVPEDADLSFPGIREEENGSYRWFASVASAVAKDLEANGKPNENKVLVFSEIQQDADTPVFTLHYQGSSESSVIYRMTK